MIYSSNPVLHLPPADGRTFVCGDLHGCFHLLDEQLAMVGFRPGIDRLLCVGDLIDRGPHSERALQFLSREGFYSVLGNHDRLMLEAIGNNNRDALDTWRRNGGEWAACLGPDEQFAWFQALVDLPIVIQTEVRGQRIGIVHAEVTPDTDWQRFRQAIGRGDRDAYDHATWGRSRLAANDDSRIVGIDQLYVGHTPLTAIKSLGNVTYIDTGAVLEGGHLTLLELP